MHAGLRIILVEDDGAFRGYLKTILETTGHQVVAEAECGLLALDLIKKMDPDVVITDIRMPGLDGLGLADQINQQKFTPFVVISGFYDDDTIKRVADSAVFSYLVKPLNVNELEPAMQMAIAKARKMEELKLALAERKVVERAKGILMKAQGISEDEAYRLLQKMARDQNKKLIEIAQAVVLVGEQVRQKPEAGK